MTENWYGTSGKRLWMRSYDGRWIPLPFGAGEDDTIRSVNIYDKKNKRWLTTTWGVPPVNNAEIPPSLLVRAPGRAWYNSGYNPNYANRQMQIPLTPDHDDYIRLSYLGPRTADPSWRIIPLLELLPNRSPSTGTIGLSYYNYFWPRGAYHYRVRQQSSAGSAVTDTHSSTTYGRSQLGDVTGRPLCSYNVRANAPTHGGAPYSQTIMASMVDFKVIRDRLATDFPERGVDYTGQYDPIQLMGTRRMYVTGKLTWSCSISGPGATADTVSNAVFKVYAQTNAPGVEMVDPDSQNLLGREYRPRYPAGVTPTGTVIWQDRVQNTSVTTRTDNLRNNITVTTVVGNGGLIGFDYDFEGPGEDNVSFYADIENVPAAGGALDVVAASLTFEATNIYIHYAEPGTDTPANTHNSAISGR